MRGLFNSGQDSRHRSWLLFQSALRMRGLFNPPARRSSTPGLPGFNPPCGCVAFSTRDRRGQKGGAYGVSIRLADAWPFQPITIKGTETYPGGFNPPCGCVAFSTRHKQNQWARSWRFQSALRMRGLFNRMSARFTRKSARFQSALRMRGLFNARTTSSSWLTSQVSIRLADAWPFQPCATEDCRCAPECFNPPCGCVAFSTASEMLSSGWESMFQSALRMRGLFNPPTEPAVCSRSIVSIRLADAWPFQQRRGIGVDKKEGRFNPPCGCVAFST